MAKRQIPKRASNPKRIARRSASFKRGLEKKEARKKLQKQREAKNRELRSEGKPTPWEALKADYRARRELKIQQAKDAGTYRAPKYNDRGFKIDVVDGHTVLIDTGWKSRRNARYNAIANGHVKVKDA